MPIEIKSTRSQPGSRGTLMCRLLWLVFAPIRFITQYDRVRNAKQLAAAATAGLILCGGMLIPSIQRVLNGKDAFSGYIRQPSRWHAGVYDYTPISTMLWIFVFLCVPFVYTLCGALFVAGSRPLSDSTLPPLKSDVDGTIEE